MRRPRLLVLLLLCTLLVGCTSPQLDLRPAEGVSRTPAGAALVVAPGSVDPDAAAEVAGILADLEDFWRARIPDFRPPRGGYALIDAATTEKGPLPEAMCAGTPGSLMGNAFYCPTEDGIVIDAAALIPVLRTHYGIGAVATSVAHEYGHAVLAQRKVGEDAEAVVREAQADCTAGAFLAAVAEGHGGRLQIADPATAMAPLLDFRDAADSDPDRAFHGLALDRLHFMLTGYTRGAQRCLQLGRSDLRLTLGTVRDPAVPQRFRDPAALRAAALTSAGEFFGRPLSDQREDVSALARIGEFGQATRIVSNALTRPGGSTATRACQLGAWTASVFGSSTPNELGGAPGDADEALLAIRSDGTDLAELQGFHDGFYRGIAACGQ